MSVWRVALAVVAVHAAAVVAMLEACAMISFGMSEPGAGTIALMSFCVLAGASCFVAVDARLAP